MILALLRSSVFAGCLLAVTPVYWLASLLALPLDARTRFDFITGWCRLVVYSARVICGIRYRVSGLDHLPAGTAVILCKHQSAWETLAMVQIAPPLVWVLKRELLNIPFFGWGLRLLQPIAIKRGSRTQALRQIEEQGRARLAAGFNVLVFPEGTRVKPGERRPYQVGGAWLAQRAGVPLVPVAHNAGRCWGRNAFVKYPGQIEVSIGPPIDTAGKNAQQLTAAAEAWIETEVERLERKTTNV